MNMVIAVDLTPFQANGINGGIGPLIISTVQELAKRGNEIVLLTDRSNHDALSFLDTEHISRSLVGGRGEEELTDQEAGREQAGQPARARTWKETIKQFFRAHILARMPGLLARVIRKCYIVLRWGKHYLVSWIKSIAGSAADRLRGEPSAEAQEDKGPERIELDRKIDVLFCPFSAVKYSLDGVPVVSQVNDIQHAFFPYYFSGEELMIRERFYAELVKRNPFICTISDYTRRSFLEKYQYAPERIITVYPAVQDRLSKYTEQQCERVLLKHGLERQSFIFFPANMWPHKNHRSLITAFNMYVRRNPDDPVKLVLTGAGLGRESSFLDEVRQLGLKDRVLWLGYVKEIDLAGLMKNCRYMIYPSFFEGFGLPVTEAMAAGVPVLCSNVTSLPEVGGEAVFYFNPYDPEDICRKMEYVREHPEEVEKKLGKVPEQLSRFDLEHYLSGLLNVFEKAVSE